MLLATQPTVLAEGDAERIDFVVSTYLNPETLTPAQDQGLQDVSFEGQATGGNISETSLRTEEKEHTVASGETLSGIAALYDLTSSSLVVANPDLSGNKHMIKPGMVLTIPVEEASKEQIQAVLAKEEKEKADKKKALAAAEKKNTSGSKKALASALLVKGDASDAPSSYKVPVGYKYVSQYFGGKHRGLDLVAPEGTPIYATADGCFIHVARSGWNGGYGNVSIQQIGSGMSALYAHQDDIYVNQGECVTKGELIGRVGLTGRTTGAHLHFEIRVNGTAVNPFKYLK